MLGPLAILFLGRGTLRRKLRAELESEGLVLVEEGLSGSVRYNHFRAPGRRFHGKITPERIGLGISRKRLVAYCRSGWVKLMDSPFDSPRFDAVDVEQEGDTVDFRVDYDRMPEAREADVSGQLTIRVHTPEARRIAEEVRARLGRAEGR